MSDRKPFETFAHYKIGKGFATLAVSVDEGNVRVGVSYCHPRDGINKNIGRSIAAARRDSGSDFSFDFTRDFKRKLGDQLRDEFENFVLESGEAQKILRTIGDNTKVRVGAPPWTIHSLNREIRQRDRFTAMLEEIVEPDITVLDGTTCSCC